MSVLGRKRGKYTKHKHNPTSFKNLTWEEYAARHLDIEGCKTCCKCGEKFPFDSYPNSSRAPFGKIHYCRSCHNAKSRAAHSRRMATQPEYRESKRRAYVKSAHGMSTEEYEAMLELQGNKCAICETIKPKGGWCLDHNHSTGVKRGFLCNPCNRGIGYLQDDEDILMKAIEYLQRTGSYATRSEGSSL